MTVMSKSSRVGLSIFYPFYLFHNGGETIIKFTYYMKNKLKNKYKQVCTQSTEGVKSGGIMTRGRRREKCAEI